ncbi:hypothetical protein HHL21_14805 [Massilia sp. RP-1-19]|uniref:Lipoprotein n=1 Tax=Massilia polaris TaxID=2728846 RepID=A0A848HSR7_9BURK|nr:hypothetical protein [Massilia polaris]NML62323.1 hypothetical protein [Massilia polaris]
MNKRLIGAVAAALLLSACATTPPKMLGAPPGNGYAMARAAGVDVTNHMTRHLDANKDILYTQASGGGGVGMGLLLGPLGVMANMKMIETRTVADVATLNNKISIAPRALFSDAMRKNGQVLSDTPQANRATPYLYIAKAEGDKLQVLSALIVESNGTPQWAGTYQYQLPMTYTVAELASLDAAGMRALNDAAANGFDQLLNRLAAEKQVRADQEQKIHFRSRLLQPMVDIEMHGQLVADEGDVVWVRNPASVVGLRKAHVTYKIVP